MTPDAAERLSECHCQPAQLDGLEGLLGSGQSSTNIQVQRAAEDKQSLGSVRLCLIVSTLAGILEEKAAGWIKFTRQSCFKN